MERLQDMICLRCSLIEQEVELISLDCGTYETNLKIQRGNAKNI